MVWTRRGRGEQPPQTTFAGLLFESWTWIERLSETISYLNTGETRRQTTLQVNIPADYSVSDHPGTVILPLTLLRKSTLKRFEVRDSEGKVLPTLAMESNWKWSSSAAISVLGGQFKLGAVERHLVEKIVEFQPEDDGDRCPSMDDLVKRLRPTGGNWSAPQIMALAAVSDLSDKFSLTVELPDCYVGRRAVIDLFYEDSFDFIQKRWNFCGPTTATIDNLSVSDADSFHLEIRTPPGISPSCIKMAPVSDFESEEWEAIGKSVTAHINVHRAGTFEICKAEAQLRPSREGIVTYAFLSSVLVLLVAGIFTWQAKPIAKFFADDAERAGSLATVLLAVPAFLLVTLARGPEHPVVALVQRTARYATLLTSGALLVAAAVVTVSPSYGVFEAIFATLSIIQAFITLIAARVWAYADGHPCLLAARVKLSLALDR
jgi:hypothetical protein